MRQRFFVRRLCDAAAARVSLLSPAQASELAPSAARQLIVRVPSACAQKVRLLDIFIARSEDGGLTAFENYCPHAGGPLNLFPDTFLAPNSEHLICTRHAALFRLDDGLCVQGPCAGKALARVDVCVDADGSVTVSEEALEQLCRRNAPTGRPRRPARRRRATS